MNTVNPRIAMAAGRPVAHTPLPTRAQLLFAVPTLSAASCRQRRIIIGRLTFRKFPSNRSPLELLLTVKQLRRSRCAAQVRGGMPSAKSPGSKGGVSYPQIVSYLESIGAKKKEIDRTPQTKEALQQLASKHGGDLADTEAVRKADAEKKQAIENNKIAAREKKIRPLSEAALRRYRLAFDHFDEDDSGELDKVEFRKAMIDSGMMPLGFEVNEMFIEADTDGNGTVSFDE